MSDDYNSPKGALLISETILLSSGTGVASQLARGVATELEFAKK
jgi:hypothetical protein